MSCEQAVLKIAAIALGTFAGIMLARLAVGAGFALYDRLTKPKPVPPVGPRFYVLPDKYFRRVLTNKPPTTPEAPR